WPADMQHNLTYCVSERFGSERDKVVTAIDTAASDWMEVANVTFSRLEVKGCKVGSPEVLFAVTPASRRSRFSMRAFFPSSPVEKRRIQANKGKIKWPLKRITGIFRHELGHVLGFRHEHVHPDSTVDREICPLESTPTEAITEYDIFSVMHYPICGGKSGNYSKLSELDKLGAALMYPFEP
ncbi:MAG: M57 family metalloprotease, partial [Pseudomonadota bacterium]